MEKDPGIYLRHILEAIANIEADTAGYDFGKFRVDRRARQLVERNLEILSEASRRLPKELKEGEAHGKRGALVTNAASSPDLLRASVAYVSTLCSIKSRIPKRTALHRRSADAGLSR